MRLTKAQLDILIAAIAWFFSMATAIELVWGPDNFGGWPSWVALGLAVLLAPVLWWRFIAGKYE